MVEHHTVYLAGKIRKNGWRNAFGYRDKFYWDLVNYDFSNLASYTYNLNDNISITGPTIISCDHGCYHGPESHGCGADGCGCMGNEFDRKKVLEMCKIQIDRAEILFAYIDSYDCYGTLAEIGYAYANNKSIIIEFATEELRRDMWFVNQMQRRFVGISAKWVEEQLLNRI